MSGILGSIGDGIGYAADALDKPGRAVRGLLAGKGREGLAVLPFSDSLGLTDHRQSTSGRDLLDHYGVTDKHDTSFGSSALGFGAGMLTDPLSYLGVGAALKGAKTFRQGAKAAAKSVTGLDFLESLGQGSKGLYKGRVASSATHSDALLDGIRLDDPLPGSLHFGDRPMPDNTYAMRQLHSNGQEIGSVTYSGPKDSRSREVADLFPGRVHEEDPVRWITQTRLDEGQQGKKLGQALYLDMMGRHPNDWFHSLGASQQAQHAADALREKGLIEHYRLTGPGTIDEFPHAGRITGAGQELLSHPDLLPSLMAGKGFPPPMPMPPRSAPRSQPVAMDLIRALTGRG